MISPMNLVEAFAKTAEQNSHKPALFWGEDEFSYADLWAQTLWVSHTLRQQFGIKPGDRVGLWLRNCPEFVPALFGIFHAGAVAVPINNFLKGEEVNYILGDGGIDVVIIDCSLDEMAGKVASLRPTTKFLRLGDIPKVPGKDDSVPSNARESDLAVIIYTSGTTGRPKGAMLSHGNLLHNVESCRIVLEAVGEDRVVVLLPMFHSFMLCVGVLLPMLIGGSMVLIKSVHPPKNILQEILQRQATILPAVPQFFRTLSHPSVPSALPLRLCISGGAPLPIEILKEFEKKFSMPLLEGYGLSEASPVVTVMPIRGPWKPGSIGVPIANVEVSVQNESGEILPPGQTGEICVRGGNVMLGYWNQPAETAKTIRNGWLLTGDIGHGDADGFFYITDRKKDMLLVNGINVYPREIEEIIYQFPGVKEAAVIGVPDSRKGEQPIAFVSANEGATIDERALQQFIRERLADYKLPRRVISLPALPRNPTGKILKTALREMMKASGPENSASEAAV
jgi:long-chain acyl-CoA synthetase